jgi:hypothetical protein
VYARFMFSGKFMRTTIWVLVMALVPGAFLWAADDNSLVDLESQWLEWSDQESLTASERLLGQTELLTETGKSLGWRHRALWDRTCEVLDAWEASPDLPVARDAYIGLLDQVCWSVVDSQNPLPDELRLREYCQRALGITQGLLEEGRLLFHLAASHRRSALDSPEVRRRQEAYLQQAILAFNGNAEVAYAHVLFADLLRQWADSESSEGLRGESLYVRAVAHYRRATALPGVDPALVERSKAALEELLSPGLRLDINNRFLPGNEVTVQIHTRNIGRVEVEVMSLAGTGIEVPVSIQDMEAFCRSREWLPSDSVISKTETLDRHGMVEWRPGEIRLGSGFQAGWYWVIARGEGLISESLLLVTSLDVVLVPRTNGDFTVWTTDAESGSPVPGARFAVLNDAGQLAYAGTFDPSGVAEILTGRDPDWSELHVVDGDNRGIVQREDLAEVNKPLPWVVSGSGHVRPGEDVQWVLLDAFGTSDEENQMLLHLPDGGELLPSLVKRVGTTSYFEATVPENAGAYGPIYLTLEENKRILVSHLVRADPLPFSIDLSGERFSKDSNIFISMSPVGMRIRATDTGETKRPDFARVQVRRLDRRVVWEPENWETLQQADVVYENIIPFGSDESGEVAVDLPELGDRLGQVPLVVELRPLDTDELLAVAHLVLVPYRALIDFSISERIIFSGDTVTVRTDNLELAESLARSPAGELVVWRETWENRYIHRKRGTRILESEFNALPERSLLGSARTDYRLAEQGMSREEVARVQIVPESTPSRELTFDKPGHYRITFTGEDADTVAQYDGGLLEVWVVPANGNFHAFRSDKSRLIMEGGPNGGHEILVLLDEPNKGLLLDLENQESRTQTQVAVPTSPGFFLQLPPGNDDLSVCRAITTGSREMEFLCEHKVSDDSSRWEVPMEQSRGLNPGSAFTWEAQLESGGIAGDPIFAMHPEPVVQFVGDWLEQQQVDHDEEVHACGLEAVSMGVGLPLFHLLEGARATGATSEDTEVSLMRTETLLGLYPEVHAFDPVGSSFVDFQQNPETEAGEYFELSGKFPSRAGRWALAVVNQNGEGGIAFQTWPLSTELPIRASLDGPSLLREGDSARILLSIENTTRRHARINVIPESSGSFMTTSQPVEADVFRGGRTQRFPLELQAGVPGPGMMEVSVETPFSSSTAYHEGTVVAAPVSGRILSFAVAPGESEWREVLDLDGWAEPRILVSAGTGGQLSAVWPVLKKSYAGRDPLLVALVDWAVATVEFTHGISDTIPAEQANTLVASLSRFNSGNGIAWTEGGPVDPWLSSLVYWSIETFAPLGDQTFDRFREDFRVYLESVLIDDAIGPGSRVFALRALAASAFHDPRLRPSRIQAKTFLDFLRNRETLGHVQIGMLLEVARAYHFNEEVRLLSDLLGTRLDEPALGGSAEFWDHSLLYLALDNAPSGASLRENLLAAAFTQIAETLEKPSWAQAGGFLNLLADFLWSGDFSIDGSAEVSINGESAQLLDLKPHAEGGGLYKHELAPPGKLELGVNAGQSPHPVLVSILGEGDKGASFNPYSMQTQQVQRKYIERTLLAGSHVSVVPVESDTTLYSGDSLLVTLEIDVDETRPHAEFRFAIPAGCQLASDGIDYAHPDYDESETPALVITRMADAGPLWHSMRVEPLTEGRHIFTLSYDIKWQGEYDYPSHQVTFPDRGETFLLGEASRVVVQEAAE